MMASLSCVNDFEVLARDKIDDNAWGYYSYGVNQEWTLRENEATFKRDVSCVDMKTTVLGRDLDMPVGIASTGFHVMAHKDGEKATARASSNIHSLMIVSVWSSISLEDVAEASGSGHRWMQINPFKSKLLLQSLISRAERAGYQAIVVTIDQPTRDIRVNGSFKLPDHITFTNLAEYGCPTTIKEAKEMLDPSKTWEDISWLKSLANLPIVVKGILTGEDAVEAVKHGVSGIMVSNHGGRQLDSVPAMIDVLSEVVAAVKGSVEVYLDGGVRQGTDILKALALDARVVFIGMPVIWGLAHNGQDGVEKVFEILKNELKSVMMLSD